ncbi:MAG: hypothetical protein NZ911_06180 [Sulfolobales archaeon]|nr:hypothetical protein [Sulfolobales archaeon]
MAFSYTVVSFIIIGMMFALLMYVGNTVITHIVTIGKITNSIREERQTSKHALIIQSAKCLDNHVFFNLSNVGSTSPIIDSSSTLILEYVSNHTQKRLVDLPKLGESWFIEGYYVTNKYYTSRSEFIELKPGARALIKVLPSDIPSPNHPILIVFTTARGARAEYVFTCE